MITENVSLIKTHYGCCRKYYQCNATLHLQLAVVPPPQEGIRKISRMDMGRSIQGAFPVAHPPLSHTYVVLSFIHASDKHYSASLTTHRTEQGKNVPFVWVDLQSVLLIFAVVCFSTLSDCWPLKSEILRQLLSLFFFSVRQPEEPLS